MRDHLAGIKLQLAVMDRSHDETTELAELAAEVYELAQRLRHCLRLITLPSDEFWKRYF